YGSLAGIATILTMIAGFERNDGKGWSTSMAVGYLIMLVACSFIFFGVKRYRDIKQGGVITFWKALGLGTLMALMAGVCYVAIWEVYLAVTDFAFIENYFVGSLEAQIADGLAGEELQAQIEKNEAFKQFYLNPLMRLPITMTEILPIGFIVAFLSAALLRKPEVLPAEHQLAKRLSFARFKPHDGYLITAKFSPPHRRQSLLSCR
ncbi:MAG: DUF4199 domain-containing protein, partial [Pseudomonadota bacterium]